MKSPFKFLDSYTKDDRDIFFGRDREIEELYQKVFDSKLLLVYGVSGTGKSSLIHCGLANKFGETDWLPLVVRRGGNIIESLAASIQTASVTPQQNKLGTPLDFKKGVRSLYLDHYKPVFFIFDQFEELFIFGDKEERRAFIHIVKSLTESELQCRMIFVMREEYMAGVTEFEKFIPTFFSNRVRIEKMSHASAIEAIEQPCKAFNISLEEGFAVTLLEKLSPGSTDVELTYLQVFLDKVFRFAQPDKGTGKNLKTISFTLPLLGKIGNVSDLLGSFLDEQISRLSNPDKGLAVLKSFVSVKGSRRQLFPEEVTEYARTLGQLVEKSALKDMLQTFINLRILRDKDESGKYELRHDALATKIYEKITLIEKEILEIRQFVDNAYNNYRKRGVYLSLNDLNYIAPYESRLFLSKELSDFTNESRKILTKAKRRRRNIAFVSAMTLSAVLSVFAIWALAEKSKADDAGIRQLESILKLNENFEKVKKNQILRKDEIYYLFEKSHLSNPDKTKDLWDKALAIKNASDELTRFIYQLELKMLSESENISQDSASNISLATIKNKSNTQIPFKVLIKEVDNMGLSNVSILKRRIQNYRKTVYDQIEKKDWDKINFGIDTDRSYTNSKGDSISWEDASFQKTTLAGAITNLNNLITEINYIELDAVTFFYSWINVGSFAFNMIQPLIIPQSNYVILGSNFKAKLLLSASDTRTNLEAYVFEGDKIPTKAEMSENSKMLPLTSKRGEINFTLKPNSIGRKVFSGYISMRRPDGTSDEFSFSSEYLVGEPAIVISPVFGNILYRGIDNIIDVSIQGVGKDKIRYQVSNGQLTLNKDGQFSFRAEEGNITTFTMSAVIDESLIFFPPLQFRIIDTPDPVLSIGGNRGGSISINDINRYSGLDVTLDNFPYDVKHTIVGYTIMTIDATGFFEEKTKGPLFSEKQKSIISRLKQGEYLFIKDVTVVGPDGQIRDLNDLIYKIENQ